MGRLYVRLKPRLLGDDPRERRAIPRVLSRRRSFACGSEAMIGARMRGYRSVDFPHNLPHGRRNRIFANSSDQWPSGPKASCLPGKEWDLQLGMILHAEGARPYFLQRRRLIVSDTAG